MRKSTRQSGTHPGTGRLFDFDMIDRMKKIDFDRIDRIKKIDF